MCKVHPIATDKLEIEMSKASSTLNRTARKAVQRAVAHFYGLTPAKWQAWEHAQTPAVTERHGDWVKVRTAPPASMSSVGVGWVRVAYGR